MDIIQNLLIGIENAFLATNLMYCLLGVIAGTFVGALPGLGPAAGIAILLPTTFGMSATTAMIMLVGVYLGTTFGGAITAILINTPGVPAAVMTAEEGTLMAKRGEAGPALGIAAISSFIGSIFGILVFIFLAPTIVKFTLAFGPPEYFALVFLGLTTVVFLGTGSLLKALISGVFGFF